MGRCWRLRWEPRFWRRSSSAWPPPSRRRVPTWPTRSTTGAAKVAGHVATRSARHWSWPRLPCPSCCSWARGSCYGASPRYGRSSPDLMQRTCSPFQSRCRSSSIVIPMAGRTFTNGYIDASRACRASNAWVVWCRCPCPVGISIWSTRTGRAMPRKSSGPRPRPTTRRSCPDTSRP